MKLSSMTGFGESSSTVNTGEKTQCVLRVQAKSVNHRFLDLSLRLPSRYSPLEHGLQKLIRSELNRGRIEVSVFREAVGQEAVLSVNAELLKQAIEEVTTLDIPGLEKSDLIKGALPSLFTRKEIIDFSSFQETTDNEAKMLEMLILEAIGKLKESRNLEGKALATEIESIISEIEKRATKVDKLSQLAPEIIKARFEERLAQLYANYNPEDPRMLQEIAVLSDKIDIREEVVRLKSHTEHFRKVLYDGGRKLEFIVQEMGREINTIGSKTSQIEVSTLVIELKSYLEKLREQLQNIE